MGNMGKLSIDPSEARSKAMSIRSYAERVNEILNIISTAMDEIDNEDTGIYQGTTKSHELKEQFNTIKTNFEPLYNQITKYAEQIELAAQMAESQ